MTKFQQGKTYFFGSVCDADFRQEVKITKRTEKSIWFRCPMKKRIIRKSIYIYDGMERAKPFGSYSMAPIMSASKVAA